MGYIGDGPKPELEVGDISTKDVTATGDVTISDKIIHSGDTNTAIRFAATDTVTIETAGSERMRVLSGGGLTFNGDTAAANALDDYEEGSWTPAITQGFTGISSYDTQVGFYTKIGNTVRAYFRLEMGGNGTANSNGVIIGGLPYTSLNNAHVYTTGTHYINVAAAGGQNSFPLVFPNSAGVYLYIQNANGVTPLSGVTAGNSLDILGQVIYESA